jgi:hypothetical protein
VVYRDKLSSTVPHWIHEIAVWLQRANTLKCKSKLKKADYIDSLFGYFGNDIEDARNNLETYQLWNARSMATEHYPDFEITEYEVDRLYEVYQNLIEVCVPTLLSGNILSVSDWEQFIKSILT